MKSKKEKKKIKKNIIKKNSGYVMSVDEWIKTVIQSEEETQMHKSKGYRDFLSKIEKPLN